jgi:glutamate synthase domain-containing protein 1
MMHNYRSIPKAQGLYDPANEHDACGVGFVVNIKGERSNDIVKKALQVLDNLTHRGACGCDPRTGDGAGILLQIPHDFFVRETAKLGFELPAPGEYGVGQVFLPLDATKRKDCEDAFERRAALAGMARCAGGRIRVWRNRAARDAVDTPGLYRAQCRSERCRGARSQALRDSQTRCGGG